MTLIFVYRSMKSSRRNIEVAVPWSKIDQIVREAINKNKGAFLYMSFSWLIIKILNYFYINKKEIFDTELSN